MVQSLRTQLAERKSECELLTGSLRYVNTEITYERTQCENGRVYIESLKEQQASLQANCDALKAKQVELEATRDRLEEKVQTQTSTIAKMKRKLDTLDAEKVKLTQDVAKLTKDVEYYQRFGREFTAAFYDAGPTLDMTALLEGAGYVAGLYAELLVERDRLVISDRVLASEQLDSLIKVLERENKTLSRDLEKFLKKHPGVVKELKNSKTPAVHDGTVHALAISMLETAVAHCDRAFVSHLVDLFNVHWQDIRLRTQQHVCLAFVDFIRGRKWADVMGQDPVVAILARSKVDPAYKFVMDNVKPMNPECYPRGLAASMKTRFGI